MNSAHVFASLDVIVIVPRCTHVFVPADNRKLLHEQEAERMLITLLGHEDNTVQIAAAQALGVMAENLTSREAISQWGELSQISYIFLQRFQH